MNIGKKILSAFVEVEKNNEAGLSESAEKSINLKAKAASQDEEKFRNHFLELLKENNFPGPDYFEFSRMVDAMLVIPVEKDRYTAAFAGLQSQGLSLNRLLSTANDYLDLLEKDSQDFALTVNSALDDEVSGRKKKLADHEKRIQELADEMTRIKSAIHILQEELNEYEVKISSNANAYRLEYDKQKEKLLTDIAKINDYLNQL